MYTRSLAGGGSAVTKGTAANGSPVTLVRVPYAAHGTAFTAPVSTGNVTCGAQLLASHILSRGTALSDTCLNELIAPDFAGTATTTVMMSKNLFGTANVWGSP